MMFWVTLSCLHCLCDLFRSISKTHPSTFHPFRFFKTRTCVFSWVSVWTHMLYAASFICVCCLSKRFRLDYPAHISYYNTQGSLFHPMRHDVPRLRFMNDLCVLFDTCMRCYLHANLWIISTHQANKTPLDPLSTCKRFYKEACIFCLLGLRVYYDLYVLFPDVCLPHINAYVVCNLL